MNVKRYFAPTVREALRALKTELGADAIVLSNRAVEGGVEILALPAEDVGAMPAARPPLEAAPEAADMFVDDEEDCRVSLSGAQPVTRARAEPPPQPVIKPFRPPRMETPDYLIRKRGYEDEAEHPPVPAPVSRPQTAAAPARAVRREATPEATREVSREMPARPQGDAATAAMRVEREREAERIAALEASNTQLMGELGSIRTMIERQLAAFAWGETTRSAPGRAQIIGELLEAGFAANLARELAASVDADATLTEARASVRHVLARDLRAMSSDADLIDRGGVFALVGPTGVGKTTTTAKIAARCVVRHGAEKLALITTDGYRIGAQEQLRIYGRILGVPVFPVRDAADLRQTISELRNKHMVLIDTMGMSQRDEMVVQQAAMLAGAGDVRRLLLLNATSGGDTLDDVIKAYRGADIAGCVFTKVDEAASLAPVVGAAIKHELEVFYVTNGQRVPEDLHLPNRAYLLHRSLRPRGEDSPWKLDAEEVGLKLAAGAER